MSLPLAFPLLTFPLCLRGRLLLKLGQLLLVHPLLLLPLLLETPCFRISVRSVSLGISRYFLHDHRLCLLLLHLHLLHLLLSFPILLLKSLVIASPVFGGFVSDGF